MRRIRENLAVTGRQSETVPGSPLCAIGLSLAIQLVLVSSRAKNSLCNARHAGYAETSLAVTYYQRIIQGRYCHLCTAYFMELNDNLDFSYIWHLEIGFGIISCDWIENEKDPENFYDPCVCHALIQYLFTCCFFAHGRRVAC